MGDLNCKKESKNETELYGLKASEVNKLKLIFAQYPEIEKVVIFGSRSMGNYKYNSDFDLAILGKNVGRSVINIVKDDLEDVFFPLSFDVIDYDSIKNKQLINHIKEEGKVLYAR